MDALVFRLEKLALCRPRLYTALAVGVALLGFAILFLVLGLALSSLGLTIAAVAYVIASGGKHVLALVNVGKILLVLGVPAWFMTKASISVLFTRLPMPEGRELGQEEAPALFAAIDRLRQQVKGPPVHKVLLTNQLNASIQQYPRFGLYGWERNYLSIGLPLLEILSEEEALAVLAHEYGHLSGHHSRLGGFIYRFRASWARLEEASGRWRDWGSRLVSRLLRWYTPYFNAYTFVLARQNEYLADRTAVEVAGRENAAAALMRFNLAAIYWEDEFWPSMWRRADAEAEPPANGSELWQKAVGSVYLAPRREKLVQRARQRKTDHFDTHPALGDRLAAMGVIDDASLAELEPPVRTAASAWLGTKLEDLQAEFDKRWRDLVAESWRARHDHVLQLRERVAELEALPALTVDQRWELVTLVEEVGPESDLVPVLDAILAADPGHHPARLRRGALLLSRGDEAGVSDVEAVMTADDAAVLPGCFILAEFYAGRDEVKANKYRERGRARNAALERARARQHELAFDDILAPADLASDVVAQIVGALREHAKRISRAYLMRRTLDFEADLHDYVLAFETRSNTSPAKATELGEKLAVQLPASLMIVHLDDRIARRFRKLFRKSGVEPLPLG
jgi:Zn-dependent protease with chaperone function